jgi:hypothetical protein
MHWATSTYMQEPANDWFGEPPGLDHFNVNGKLQWFLPGTNPSTPAPPLPPGVTTAAPKPPPTPAPAPTPPPDNGGPPNKKP